jgi:hypothetical protein
LWQSGAISLYGRAPLSESYERIPISVSRDSKCIIDYYGNTIDTGWECWAEVHLQQTQDVLENQSFLDCFEKRKDNFLQLISEPETQICKPLRARKKAIALNSVVAACEAWWPRHEIPDHLTVDARDRMILDWSTENGGPKRISPETIRRGIALFRKNGLH